ncbi:uncharacterized protein LOC126324752 [Schistocerca gregaria]|uniref:uncharacterized protein LOC126324752 n=1 Tax=Schistocerca gregaria TaxID=7010 RepID=UPI00211EF13B|nr:uncharacterized protein LOC126324752 [Schistocerca gregaria]
MMSFKYSRRALQVVILKATRSTPKPSKEKYIKIITINTFNREAVIDIISTLGKRLEKNSWHAVLKALIIIHHCFREGSPAFIECLKTRSVQMFNLKQFSISPLPQVLLSSTITVGHIYSIFVRKYSKHLEEQVSCFCYLGFQFNRKLDCCKNLSIKDSLKYIPEIQCQFNTLLNCKMRTGYVTKHPLSIAAYTLLIKDSLDLYLILNEGILRLVDRCFEMDKEDAKQVLSIYTLFIQETDCLISLYSIVSDFAKDLPQIQRPKANFIKSLQDHINRLDNEHDVPRSSPSDMAHQTSQNPIKPHYESSPSVVESDNLTENGQNTGLVVDARNTNSRYQPSGFNTTYTPNDLKPMLDAKETNSGNQPAELNTSKYPPNVAKSENDSTDKSLNNYSNNCASPGLDTAVKSDSVNTQILVNPNVTREINSNIIDTTDDWKSLHSNQHLQGGQENIPDLLSDVTFPFYIYTSNTSQLSSFENPFRLPTNAPMRHQDRMHEDNCGDAWKNQLGNAIQQEGPFLQSLKLDSTKSSCYYPAQSRPPEVKPTLFEDLIASEPRRHIHSSINPVYANTSKDTINTPDHMAPFIKDVDTTTIDRPNFHDYSHNPFSPSPVKEALHPNPFYQTLPVKNQATIHDSENNIQELVYLSETNNDDKPKDYYNSSYNPFLQR